MVSKMVIDLEQLSQPSVIQLAQLGDVDAIAHWLNTYLLPQGIQAQVNPDRPGRLNIFIEFQRLPDRDRLVRFICHRLCKLNSGTIKTVRIVARFIRTPLVLWEQTVRISPTHKPHPPAQPAVPVLPAARQLTSALVVRNQQPSQFALPIEQLKLNKPLLVGSAIAAFLIGSGFDAVYHYTLTNGLGQPSSSPDADHASARPQTVQTALEQITVTQQIPIFNPNDPTVTLVFSGDAVLHESSEPNHSPLQLGGLPVDMAAYHQADIALTSLDEFLSGHLTSDQLGTPAKNKANTLPIETLAEKGADIVHLANNQGAKDNRSGLVQTLRALEATGIHTIGAGRNQREARRPEILDVRGQRVAYLGYSDSDLGDAGRWTAGINASTHERVAADIQAIRDQVDWVIVNYRWHQELAEYPATWQMELAHFAIDQGADLVVGYHPHVLQGAEIYNGRAIAYSLGDFIFADSKVVQGEYDTAMLQVSLRDQQMRLEFLPIQVRQFNPKIVDGDEGKAILNYLEQASGLFEQPMRSPAILDTRPRNPPPKTAPTNKPSIQTPSPPSPMAPVEPPDSFVTFPDAPTSQPDQKKLNERIPQKQLQDSLSPKIPAKPRREMF